MQLIRRVVHASPHEISIIAIGPLTNVAIAFREDPELPRLIPNLTIMGGSLSGGNITPSAEFNIYVDPEAAPIVFRSGVPLTMVGLDVTRKAMLREKDIQRLEASNKPEGRAAGKIMRSSMNTLPQRSATEVAWGCTIPSPSGSPSLRICHAARFVCRCRNSGNSHCG